MAASYLPRLTSNTIKPIQFHPDNAKLTVILIPKPMKVSAYNYNSGPMVRHYALLYGFLVLILGICI